MTRQLIGGGNNPSNGGNGPSQPAIPAQDITNVQNNERDVFSEFATGVMNIAGSASNATKDLFGGLYSMVNQEKKNNNVSQSNVLAQQPEAKKEIKSVLKNNHTHTYDSNNAENIINNKSREELEKLVMKNTNANLKIQNPQRVIDKNPRPVSGYAEQLYDYITNNKKKMSNVPPEVNITKKYGQETHVSIAPDAKKKDGRYGQFGDANGKYRRGWVSSNHDKSHQLHDNNRSGLGDSNMGRSSR